MPSFPTPREQGETFLIVFDFDETIGDGDCDERVTTQLGLAEPFGKVLPLYSTPEIQWTNTMSDFIAPYTREAIAEAVGASVKVPAATIEAFKLLHDLSKSDRVEVAIASDANTLFIEEAFKQVMKVPAPRIYSNGFVDLRETPEGPQTCPATGRTLYSRLVWHSPDGHDCVRCRACPNMCKSAIVQKALNDCRLKDPTVIFVGDGFNDSCPMQKVLRLRDHVFARRGFRLEKILMDASEAKGVCHHHTWYTGEDLFALIRDVVGNDAKRLPPVVRFSNEGGSDDEFRTLSLLKRMPEMIDRLVKEAAEKGTLHDEALVRDLTQLSADVSEPRNGALIDATNIVQNESFLPIPPFLLRYGSSWRDLPWLHGEIYLNLLLWHCVYHHALSAGESRGPALLSKARKPLLMTVEGIHSWAIPATLSAGQPISPDCLNACVPTFDMYRYEKKSVTEAFFESHIRPMVAQVDGFVESHGPAGLAVGSAGAEEVRREIRRLLSACVWGNTVDLSMFNRAELATLRQQEGSPHAGHAADHSVLDAKVAANDMDAAADYLLSRLQHYAAAPPPAGGPSAIDIVMDNMGVECAADMLLGYALASLSHGALRVRYHTKPIPYYVSDVMPSDIEEMLTYWEAEDGALKSVATQFRALLVAGSIEVHTHPFWVHPSEYRDMPSSLVNAYFFAKTFGVASPKCKAVGKHETKGFGTVDEIIMPKSDLVIFKGDVNYRRVCGDRHWTPEMFFLKSLPEGAPSSDRSVPFTEVIGSYWPYRAVPMLALRTNKSEVCVGPSVEVMRALDIETDKAWRVNGKYAVALFAQ